MSRWGRRAAAIVAVLAVGCGGGEPEARAPATTAPATTAPPTVTEIAVRLERAVDDDATAAFAEVVMSTLTDPRGWSRAGFAFTFSDDAPYTIVLAEGPDVDARCLPYDTSSRFSCQLGPVVALNADRWRMATPEWTGDLDGYRRMLVNHEVGHLLGQHHPVAGCTTPGEPAAIMVQQSTELDGCLANPWPLDWEIECAASGIEPLAPPYEPDASPLCGPG